MTPPRIGWPRIPPEPAPDAPPLERALTHAAQARAYGDRAVTMALIAVVLGVVGLVLALATLT